MLRPSPVLSAAQASQYYRAEFSRGDYYAEGADEGIVASRWHGEGARELRLSGRVRAEHFTELLEGKDLSGEVLVAHREGRKERRAGWDVTVAPHKSVTLTALVGGDQRLLEAHDRAAAKAVAELERHVQAWVHGGRGTETTGKAVVATFRHETSRKSPVEGTARSKAATTIDPQLHTHCVFMNATRRADGEWRAVEARGIFRAQKFARAVYHAELSAEIRRLGYEVQIYPDGRRGRIRATGIAGFRQEQLDHFSNRSRQIEKALAARGLDSRRHGSRMAVATRAAKDRGIDREALAWRWRTAAQEVEITFPRWREPDLQALLSPAYARDKERDRVEAAARESVSGAVSHLSERQAVFSLQDLERESLVRGMEHGVTIDHVRAEVERRPDLVIADPHDVDAARVTTLQAVEDDRAILAAVERGRCQALRCPGFGPGHGLAEDQARAARHILEAPDRLIAVEGKAGVGKTTTLSAVREIAERAGWTVRGFAPTTTAAEVLREGGITSTTVAALLNEPLPRLPAGGSRRQLWVVDEAGLLPTRQARGLVERAEQVGAKVVFVGDRAQHQAVEAGSPFALMIEDGRIATERLDVVRRQQDEQLRAVVVAASERGGTAEAVRALEASGRVVEIEDLRARHERIASDFVADGGRGVVIAPSNAERADLNHRIREKLVEAGVVERQSFKAQVAIRRDLTADEKMRAANLVRGDRLRFTRSGEGIQAGERAQVITPLGSSKVWVRYEDREGPRLLDLRKRHGFEVERFEARRFAVGDRIQFRERDRGLDVANGTVGTIRKLDRETGMATVEVGSRKVKVDLREPRAIDHAYAVTSHRSQGLSRERVYVSIDTKHSAELVNRRQFYVSVSRAVQDARVYTDDRAGLARAVAREQSRPQAVEVAERAQARKGATERGPEVAEKVAPARAAEPARLGGEPRKDVRTKAEAPARPIEVAERSRHGLSREAGRDDAARDLGSGRREPGADRGREVAARGGQGPARDDARAARPERGGAAGPDRVPQPAPEPALRTVGPEDRGLRSGPGRAAEAGAGPGRADTRPHERDRASGPEAARQVVSRDAGDDRGRRPLVRDRSEPGAERGHAGAAGRPERGRPGEHALRPDERPRAAARLEAERPAPVEAAAERRRRPGLGAEREAVRRPAEAVRERGGERALEGGRVLGRQEIEHSPDLRRAYAQEYRQALTMTPDRELAKDMARVNLSARVQGQAPVITHEAVAKLGLAQVKDVVSQVNAVLHTARVALAPIRIAMGLAARASREMER